MDLLHQGVVAGELSLARWVEVASTTPARMFGLYPRKGVIAPGSDADIVIYDPPEARQVLSAQTHHMNVDYSAYTRAWRSPAGWTPCCPAASVVIDGGMSITARGGPRPVPAAGDLSVPDLTHLTPDPPLTQLS